MNQGETIYVVTYGSIDENDSFNSAYAERQDAINTIVATANEVVEDALENDDGEWMAASNLDTQAVVRRSSLVEGNPPIDMCWWNIQEVTLK